MQRKNRTISLFLLLLATLGISFNLDAQNERVPYSSYQYSYIQYDSCYLEHYGKDLNLKKFYQKLDKLCFEGEGQISIMHLGASHIQAGVWSWEMRSNFESLCPGMEGAPGMVFPFSIAETNHPFYYRSTSKGNWEISKVTDKEPQYAMGLAGITAVTTDTVAEISIFFNPVAKIQNHKFNKISVFHNILDTSYSLTALPAEFLDTCIVNEITGASEFYFTKDIDSVNLLIQKRDTTTSAFYFYGAYLQNSEPGINYAGIGINGAATHSYLKAELFPKHLLAVKPDLVILSIGVNDAAGQAFAEERYVANYRKVIDIILTVNPDCAIILTTNNDFYQYRGGVNQHFGEIYSGMKSLATTYGGSVWNMYRVMGGYKSINYWKNDNLAANDRIHFTRDGYRIIAGLLFDAIIKDYENYLRILPQDSVIIE